MSSAGTSAVPADDAGCEASDDAPVQVLKLYQDHAPALIRQLAAHARSSEVARDLTHDAFVNFLRLPPEMLARIRRPDAFLRRVGTNILRDWARSRQASDSAVATVEVSANQSFDQVAVLEARDTLRRLEQAIEALRPKTRQIFLDQRIHGLSYAEIAARNGISVKAVEKHMAKAIAKIDRLLDRD